eukprot:1296860-Amphidinium_carterae.1
MPMSSTRSSSHKSHMFEFPKERNCKPRDTGSNDWEKGKMSNNVSTKLAKKPARNTYLNNRYSNNNHNQ